MTREGYKCFICQHQLVIDDTWGAVDMGYVDEDKYLTDEDYIDTLMSCPYCGATYELGKTPPSERINYPFFTEQ